MPDALVTGAAGFVGRHIVRKLLALNYSVVGIDNLLSGIHPDEWLPALTEDERKRFHFIPSDCRRMFGSDSDYEFDLVFHCAAVVGGRLKIEGDPLAVATDLSIDAEFFNWVVRLKKRPRRVVYFSSSAVYPIELQRADLFLLKESYVGFDTDSLSKPDMSYGWSKLTGEYLAQTATEKYKLPVVIYRPFSGYGEDQDKSYPFPAIIERVATYQDPIAVWGSGKQCRDFIHIDDVVDAVFETMVKMSPGSVLNLGTGIATSFFDLVELAKDVANCNSKVESQPNFPEGVFYRVADVTKMNRYYVPRISLREGIERALERRKKHALGLTEPG